MDSDQGRLPEQWRLESILAYLHLDDKHNAKEILYSILTSTDILTWNSQGEIVYRGHDIRGTVIDILRYCVTHYDPDVLVPYGMGIFLANIAITNLHFSAFRVKRLSLKYLQRISRSVFKLSSSSLKVVEGK